MKKRQWLLGLVLLILILVFSTTVAAGRQLTNNNWLLNHSASAALRQEAGLVRADSFATANNHPVVFTADDGAVIALMDVIDGRPVYYTTFNTEAALTSGADELWFGGSTGLNLSGDGVLLGLWDSGKVLYEHQEFDIRLEAGDNASSISSHSTHVAGTMIASGVDSTARGMSYHGRLKTFDWYSDESEMSLAAAQGLQVSNHSYGAINGWRWNFFGDNKWAWLGNPNISLTEDYHFGAYNYHARDWDEIAYNAPNYLIVRAAGNDRDDRPDTPNELHWALVKDSLSGAIKWDTTRAYHLPDGGLEGYDSIIGDAGGAKNVLSVGAVYGLNSAYEKPEDVEMSWFSGWGPTDDGRIKPDIVSAGVGIYSTSSNSPTSYRTSSGTSMAAPSVSGSVGLLLELQNQLYPDSIMTSATLRALLIHSANPAGPSEGPDYMFGWGLLNIRGAAELMTRNEREYIPSIYEDRLDQGGTWITGLISDGTGDMRVTLSWTDPPGVSRSSSLNDRTPQLVNDLDVRITDIHGNVWKPYVLDVENPSAAATTGDNLVDNKEQIYIKNPPAGVYGITVTHKDELENGFQMFSLIATSSVSIPLPIETTSFEATIVDKSINLSWTTISDSNVTGFDIEHLENDIFKSIGLVDRIGDPGEPVDYHFAINNVKIGEQVFRLRYIYSDGTAEYSEVLTTFVELPVSWEISQPYPNPFTNRTTFEVAVSTEQLVQVSVFDLLGRRIAVLQDGLLSASKTYQFELDGNDLPAGVYFISITGTQFNVQRKAVLVR